jgi:hypothetical protein
MMTELRMARRTMARHRAFTAGRALAVMVLVAATGIVLTLFPVTLASVPGAGASTARAALTLLAATVLCGVGAAVNIANLTSVGIGCRRRDLVLRAVFGATRWRLALPEVIQAVAIAAAGSFAGTLAGHVIARAIALLAAPEAAGSVEMAWPAAAPSGSWVSRTRISAASCAAAGRRYTSAVTHPSHHALRRTLVRRLVRNGSIAAGLLAMALALGAAGYHLFAGFPWIDAVLNAAMILTGMGPVTPVTTKTAKIFAACYALFSGIFFLTMVAVLLGPALQHLLHRFHLEFAEEQSRRAAAHPGRTSAAAALEKDRVLDRDDR